MLERASLVVERAWFEAPRLLLLLLPLEWLFAALTAFRRLAFRKGWLASGHPGVPVIVVGNLTVGGTGKTPVVVGIAQALNELGFRVAVVSRGYGGSAAGIVEVTPQSDYQEVGDEALLIAQNTKATVVVGRDRLAAARHAVSLGAEIVVSDDGLQHYALQRDVEVVTSDAKAGFGNGHLLPVGPLREPPRRLATVDFFLQRDGQDPHSGTRYIPKQFRRLSDGELRGTSNPGFGPVVHAMAAIAQPQRFFESLRALGMQPEEHCYADHRPFLASDFNGLNDLPVIVTAKDAVKCPRTLPCDVWIMDMEIEFPEGFMQQLLKRASLPAVNIGAGVHAQGEGGEAPAQHSQSGGDSL